MSHHRCCCEEGPTCFWGYEPETSPSGTLSLDSSVSWTRGGSSESDDRMHSTSISLAGGCTFVSSTDNDGGPPPYFIVITGMGMDLDECDCVDIMPVRINPRWGHDAIESGTGLGYGYRARFDTEGILTADPCSLEVSLEGPISESPDQDVGGGSIAVSPGSIEISASGSLSNATSSGTVNLDYDFTWSLSIAGLASCADEPSWTCCAAMMMALGPAGFRRALETGRPVHA